MAWVSCCDWGKLWLFVILLKILLIMLSWHPFSFNNCFILAFSLCKSFLFVIMEYALLNKEETTTFLTTCLLVRVAVYLLVSMCRLTSQQTFVSLQDMSWRRLQHVFSVTILRLEDVLKTSLTRLQRNNFTSWRRLEDVFKTSWKKKNCYAEDVLGMSWRHALKTFWRHALVDLVD